MRRNPRRALAASLTGSDAALVRRATRRLGLQIGACVALIIAVVSTVAILVVIHDQQQTAAMVLDQAVNHTGNVDMAPVGTWLVVDGPAGRRATAGLPGELPDTAALDHTARTGAPTLDYYSAGGRNYRVLTVRQGPDTVQAALDLRRDNIGRRRLGFALLASGGVGLVLGAVASVWLSRRAVEPLASALALQRRFVSDASHELRTPLTLLSTRAQLLRRRLRRDGVPSDLADEADTVVADARHLTAVLEDLLLTADSRPDESGDTVDLAELAEQTVAAHAGGQEDRPITLTIHRPPEPVPVRGTATALRRAVTALLDNAVRYADTTVTVAVHRRRHEAVLDVVDDGPGIDAEIMPRLFERFTTAHTAPASAAPRRRHYGLGLALVSDVAARHGGDVTAANVPGGGARLRLVLPLDTTT